MADRFTAEVLELLAPLLTLGDVCRLRRALGAAWRDDATWPVAVVHVQRLRVGLVRPTTLGALAAAVAASRRCAECARRRRRPRVCQRCAADPQPVALWTRRQIVAHFSDRAPSAVRRRIVERLCRVKVNATGPLTTGAATRSASSRAHRHVRSLSRSRLQCGSSHVTEHTCRKKKKVPRFQP